MALPTTYNTGTATIAANDTAVTGQGTTWLTSGIQAGDLFMAAGLSVVITAVNSNTSITLADPWPGGARATASYRIQFTPDATRVLATTRAMLDALTNGNLYSIANLTTAADKIAYFTGAGTSALAAFTAFARSLVSAADQATARNTLGLGSAAIYNIGTSGAALGRLDTGNIWSNGQVMGAGTGDAYVGLNARVDANAYIRGQKAGSNRWTIFLGSNAAETGGNTGSPFQVQRSDDAGAYIDTPLQIARDTGIVGILRGAAINGGGAALAMASGTSITFAGTSAAATRTNLGLGSAALETVGSSGTAIGRLSSANTWTGTQTFGDGTTNSLINIVSGIGFSSYINATKNGSRRWSVYLGNASAESGGNAGSDFVVTGFDDTGANLGSYLTITRATGVASFSRPVRIPSFTVSTLPSASANPQGIAYVSNGTANKRFAISDGTDWRFPDGAIVS